jgi:HlyD family secretion protein
VDQVLTGVGTIAPVSQATVAFPAAGTVSSVGVHVGDKVAAGAALASLDTAALQASVSQAQATLDQAKLTLERARNGQSTPSTSAGASSAGSSGAATPASSTSSSSGTASAVLTAFTSSDDSGLQAAQQAVIDDQKQVDADLAAADQALASAHQTCASMSSATSSGDGSPSTTTTTAPTSQATTTTTAPGGGSNEQVGACYNALAAVLSAQQKVQQSQNKLASASSDLDQLLAQQASTSANPTGAAGTTPTTAPAAPGATAGGSGASAGSAGSGAGATAAPSTGNSGSTATSASPSAADLVADQKAVDADADKVAVAQQALQQATIVSPVTGTVTAVNLSAGDTVTSASSTATIVITGDGTYEGVTMVKVTDLPSLKVGQAAAMTPDGTGRTLSGQVVGIGLVSTSGTTGTTYPVTVALAGDTHDLRNGAVGTVAITTAQAATALAAPSTAVHANNGRYTVTVLDAGKAKNINVEIGAIGAAWTEIKSGLTAGQTVVVADLSQALPGSATSSSNGQQRTPFGNFTPPVRSS